MPAEPEPEPKREKEEAPPPACGLNMSLRLPILTSDGPAWATPAEPEVVVLVDDVEIGAGLVVAVDAASICGGASESTFVDTPGTLAGSYLWTGWKGFAAAGVELLAEAAFI
jgi:hypothetical protein